ncbi:MAG: hypothetical protein J7M27_03825, partial [Candidatus Latescibacteria bacterium]|nr:hypothetical protein [Candidatus Latescibacterota bacterium]
RSPIVRATPNLPPRLLEAQPHSPRHVALLFSEPLVPSAQIPAHYTITADTFAMRNPKSEIRNPRHPASTIIDQNSQRVLLGFEQVLPPGAYIARVEGVRDTTGVFLSSGANSATFIMETPVSATRILSAEALSATEIRLVFSEGILDAGIENSSFSILPEVTIEAIVHTPAGREVRLLLAESDPLKAHGHRYEIRATDLTDLNGTSVSDVAYLKWAREDLSHLIVFPNPCALSESPLTFANLTSEATIQVYTLDGLLVKTLIEQDGDGGAEWDGRNEQGARIGSGIYLYSVESKAQRRMGKFAVIR